MAFNKRNKTVVVSDEIASTSKQVEEPKADQSPAPAPASLTLEEAVPVVSHPKFRVLKTAKVSYFGQMIILHKDDLLDSSGYGMDGICRLLDAGAELEEVM